MREVYNSLWSDEELKDSVILYVKFLKMEIEGKKINKNQEYDLLAKRYGRTSSSISYRMGNISAVCQQIGHAMVKGIGPLSNVGNNGHKIADFLRQEISYAGKDTDSIKEDRESVNRLFHLIDNGGKAPTKKVINSYSRDVRIKTAALLLANGICDCCQKLAPFVTKLGKRYLEVHHIQPLGLCGKDEITNVCALCPNCHREVHLGIDNQTLTDKIKKSIASRKNLRTKEIQQNLSL